MILPKKEALLISPRDILPSSKALEVIGTINPSAIRLPNGDICLYVRVIEKLIKTNDGESCYSPRFSGKESFELAIDKFPKKKTENDTDLDFTFKDGTKRLTYISHLRRIVLSPDGFQIKKIDKKPSFSGLSWDGELGIEDSRITFVDGKYAMTYVSLSTNENISTSLAISNDCKNWFRRGIIFEQQNKDAVIFPEKIGDYFYAFNRPEGNFEFSTPHIWISKSRDLEIWGKSKQILLTKNKKSWDSGRVGAGCPPIKTEKGWLLIYHGVTDKKEGKKKRAIYSAGAALFDLNNPQKLIAKTPEPLIFPDKDYEHGLLELKDVFFPTGLVLDQNGKDILLYSGGGDVVTSVKKFSLSDILGQMKKV